MAKELKINWEANLIRYVKIDKAKFSKGNKTRNLFLFSMTSNYGINNEYD